MSAKRKCPNTVSGTHQWVTTRTVKKVVGRTMFQYDFQECGACGDNNMKVTNLGRVKGKHER